MKFKFKIQQYQTDAVDAVIRVFSGQPYQSSARYIRDIGSRAYEQMQMNLLAADEQIALEDIMADTGYKNESVVLSDTQLLENIHALQTAGNIRLSPTLVKDFGRCSLDIEMETGTGKTYVYIKTMFELNKLYGWSKFIVVVPSIAIREGVKKSFEITAEHFMEHYGKKARFFVYNSSNLTQIDNFSASSGINVMIINMQAFNTSLKEGASNKESRIIYSKRDEFGSRRPIDVIKANRPIVILDEPQKMGGDATKKAIKNFNPLFTLNYSATHKEQHNLIYVLDALDAYNKRLVKKIEVKGFEVKNLTGTNRYLFLEQIVLSAKKPPRARLEFEVSHAGGIKREVHILDVGDDLYYKSNRLEQYKGYVISEIDPIYGRVVFLNGEILLTGEVQGDVSERDMRRIQIRETILSHFEKEEALFLQGVKTLSLFFIDEVAKYRVYDDDGQEALGEYGVIFEQEYTDALNFYLRLGDSPYQRYLREHCSDVHAVHKGYFSIDKKTGRSINSELKRGADISDDISAYDLILKNKERLLSFDEPTRFIFSHSALREGWDNPNVFQICTLKHSDSNTAKRQEVGRGLRLCVDSGGVRLDAETVGDSVHDINKLTVIASESYKSFVAALQADMRDVLYDRPTQATIEYFDGKTVKTAEGPVKISTQQAKDIYRYLVRNDYVDDTDQITDSYRTDRDAGAFAPLPVTLQLMADEIHRLIQGVFDDSVLHEMVEDGNKTKLYENPLNENFMKKEFQALWERINHKYAYKVEFDSEELIRKCVESLNANLRVTKLTYVRTKGEQRETLTKDKIESGSSFDTVGVKTATIDHADTSDIKYDLVGKIADGTVLTRRTVVRILQGMREDKVYMFRDNPEEFISKVIRLINEQKATMIVDHITYNVIDGTYDSAIFTAEKATQPYAKAFHAQKAIQDYVYTDGYAANGQSGERRFAEALDSSEEVVVYAKLPKGFHIPTPVGNYAPDWAIAFKEGSVKHIYFVAETKGTMSSMELKPIEKAKIDCAKKLFNEMSFSGVRYDVVNSYSELMNIVKQ